MLRGDSSPSAARVCECVWQTAHASNYTRSMYGNGHIVMNARDVMVQSPFCCFFASHYRTGIRSVSRLYGNSSNWPLMNCLTIRFGRQRLLGCVTANQFAHQIGRSSGKLVIDSSPTPRYSRQQLLPKTQFTDVSHRLLTPS